MMRPHQSLSCLFLTLNALFYSGGLSAMEKIHSAAMRLADICAIRRAFLKIPQYEHRIQMPRVDINSFPDTHSVISLLKTVYTVQEKSTYNDNGYYLDLNYQIGDRLTLYLEQAIQEHRNSYRNKIIKSDSATAATIFHCLIKDDINTLDAFLATHEQLLHDIDSPLSIDGAFSPNFIFSAFCHKFQEHSAPRQGQLSSEYFSEQSLLHLAALFKSPRVVEFLCRHGANPNTTNHPCKFTPLTTAIPSSFPLSRIQSPIEVMDILEKRGARFDVRDIAGRGLLYIALEKQYRADLPESSAEFPEALFDTVNRYLFKKEIAEGDEDPIGDALYEVYIECQKDSEDLKYFINKKLCALHRERISE